MLISTKKSFIQIYLNHYSINIFQYIKIFIVEINLLVFCNLFDENFRKITNYDFQHFHLIVIVFFLYFIKINIKNI